MKKILPILSRYCLLFTVYLFLITVYCLLFTSGIFAQTEPITIEGQASSVSAEIEISSKGEVPITPSPTSTPTPTPSPVSVLAATTDNSPPPTGNTQTGSVTINTINFPQFQQIGFALEESLKTLLPAKRGQTLSLPSIQQTLKFNTFVIPGTKQGNSWSYDLSRAGVCNTDTAQEDATLPEFWGELVGATKGLLHLTPAKRLANEVKYLKTFSYQLPVTERACDLNLFSPGPSAKPNPLPPVDNSIKPGFTVLNLITYFTDKLDDLGNIIAQLFEKRVKVLPNAALTAGEVVANDSTNVGGGFTSSKRMKDFKPQDQNAILTVSKNDTGIAVDVALSPANGSQGNLNLAQQAKTRNYNCAALCSAYSEKRVKEGQYWVGPNTLCPSCDAGDYQK